MEHDLFPSAAEHCTISASQEELLRRIGFAGKHESDSAEEEDCEDVYLTPPEEASVQSSDGGGAMATNCECTDGERAVDLERDTDLGFWVDWTATLRVSGGESESQVRALGTDSQKARVSKRVLDSGEHSMQSLAKKGTGGKVSALETISGGITASNEKIADNSKLVDQNKDFDKSKAKSSKKLDDENGGDLVIRSVGEGLTASLGGRSKILQVNLGMETPNALVEIAKEKILKSLEECGKNMKSLGSDDKHKVKFHSGSSAKMKLDFSIEFIPCADAEVEKSDNVLEAVDDAERDGLVSNLAGATSDKDGMDKELDGDDKVHRNNRREHITRSVAETEKFRFTGKTDHSRGKEVVGDVRNRVMDKHLSNKEARSGHGGQVQMSRKRTRGVENIGSTFGESLKVGRGMRRLPESIQRSAMDVESGLDSRILPKPIQHPAMGAEKGMESCKLPPLPSREVTPFDVLKWIARPSEEDKNVGKMNVLDVARQCGIVFPRPRWWPEEGF